MQTNKFGLKIIIYKNNTFCYNYTIKTIKTNGQSRIFQLLIYSYKIDKPNVILNFHVLEMKIANFTNINFKSQRLIKCKIV